MNKEKLLELISKALDDGARLSLNLSQYHQNNGWPWSDVSEEESLELAQDFALALGKGSCITHNDDTGEFADYTVKADGFYISCSYVKEKKEEEAV